MPKKSHDDFAESQRIDALVLLVPGLYHDLTGNLAAGDFDRGRAEHALNLRIPAGLGKRHAIAALDTILDRMGHRAPANVIEIFGNGSVTADLPRLVRWVELVDDQQHGVIRVEPA